MRFILATIALTIVSCSNNDETLKNSIYKKYSKSDSIVSYSILEEKENDKGLKAYYSIKLLNKEGQTIEKEDSVILYKTGDGMLVE